MAEDVICLFDNLGELELNIVGISLEGTIAQGESEVGVSCESL